MEALHLNGLLPRVMSGTSAGSIVWEPQGVSPFAQQLCWLWCTICTIQPSVTVVTPSSGHAGQNEGVGCSGWGRTRSRAVCYDKMSQVCCPLRRAAEELMEMWQDVCLEMPWSLVKIGSVAFAECIKPYTLRQHPALACIAIGRLLVVGQLFVGVLRR